VETTVDSLFQIGSVIKLLTATLEMQLVDDGLVDLDVPASEYLPGLRFGEGCTVRDLLTHSSGVDGDLVEDFGRGDDAIGRYVDARACRSEPQGSACRRSVRVVRMDARHTGVRPIGVEQFFSEHGFGPSRSYELVWDERRYPHKAILGTAYELATGQRLGSSDFEGGKSGAVAVLRKLGFTIEDKQ
jgi:hypothetical protein